MFIGSRELGLGSEGGSGKGRFGQKGELFAAATLALSWTVVKRIIPWYLQQVRMSTHKLPCCNGSIDNSNGS